MPCIVAKNSWRQPPMSYVGTVGTHKIFVGGLAARQDFDMLKTWGVALAVDCRNDRPAKMASPTWHSVRGIFAHPWVLFRWGACVRVRLCARVCVGKRVSLAVVNP